MSRRAMTRPAARGGRPCADAQPPAHDRAAARRSQVLRAAVECFRRQGFHGASMAEISRQAGMSPGHIYHYFENKEEIIECIVRQDLEEALSEMGKLELDQGDIPAAIVTHMDTAMEDHLDRDRASLMMEVLAEAGRNPRVATMLGEADAQKKERLRALLAKGLGGGADARPEDLDGKAEVLIMLFMGLVTRAIANPGLDRPAVIRQMTRTLEHLLA